MDRMKIAAIFADQEQLGGKEITVCGWARTIRDMKTFGFIELNDGSCFRNLQVVMSADELHNYKEIAGQNVGAALIVRGTVVLTPEAKQFIIDAAYDPQYGARPLRRYLQHTVETLLAKKMIEGDITPESRLMVTVQGEDLKIEVAPEENS